MQPAATRAKTYDDPATPPAFAAARAICRRHARSFYFASFFLPADKRAAAYAVYAFCRMIDDAIDEPGESGPPRGSGTLSGSCALPGSLESRLGEFIELLDAVYADRLTFPAWPDRSEREHALYAFAQTVHRYTIPREYFSDLAEGCGMDLRISRYATWGALEKYCYRVAGVVGLVMSAIFGVTDSRAAHRAVQLGNAMQLTNILRDVKEDFERGRIYLPLEDLARFNYSERDLAAGLVNDNFRALMRFEIARARALYREGSAGLAALPNDGSRFTAAAMGTIYAGILTAIEKQDYDVFCARAHLTTVQKFGRLPTAYRLTRREADEPVPLL